MQTMFEKYLVILPFIVSRWFPIKNPFTWANRRSFTNIWPIDCVLWIEYNHKWLCNWNSVCIFNIWKIKQLWSGLNNKHRRQTIHVEKFLFSFVSMRKSSRKELEAEVRNVWQMLIQRYIFFWCTEYSFSTRIDWRLAYAGCLLSVQ